MTSFETPILLLIFNRPNHTKRVFDQIRRVKPAKLFVVADGPRKDNSDDRVNCELVRSMIMNMIDWECDVKTRFRDNNLGCGVGPAEGITWFFEQVEMGIILEDDCMPSLSFFTFCSLLLMKYRNAENIFAISGFNYCGKWKKKKYDYFFSDGGNWGWASWRRAWQFFDYSMKTWEGIDEAKRKQVTDFYPDFNIIYNKIKKENFDAWDIQWHYARLYHNALSITPTLNLVMNIGFDHFATHTSQPNSYISKLKSFEISFAKELKGPADFTTDLAFRKEILKFSEPKRENSLLRIAKKTIKRILGLSR